jgi:hypothetical protein
MLSLGKFGGAFQLGQQPGQQFLLTVVECRARIRRFVRFEPQADQIGDLSGGGLLCAGLESQRYLGLFERLN